jgi:hypothetical protein
MPGKDVPVNVPRACHLTATASSSATTRSILNSKSGIAAKSSAK